MFDFGWAEILIVATIALFVIGPKDLPAIGYQLGKMVRRVRYFQYAITGQFDDFMARAEAKESQKNAPQEKEELDHDPYDEAEADAELIEMMPLPEDNKKQEKSNA